MEKLENLGRPADETFRGHSGWEAHEIPISEDSKKTRVVLTIGVLIAALLVCGVVFFVSPMGSRFNPSHPIAIRCVDNSKCAAAGLVGDCCPPARGKKLDCCTAGDNFVTPTLTADGACDDNSACAARGLLGSCCPNPDGVSLDCCRNPNNTAVPPHAVSAQCAKNPGCKRLGIKGNCCPTDIGTNLDCCPPTTPPTSAHP
ncbi:hypothetical protein CTAYLR_008133 [Chrysophaeum taylorii]|uniref:Uncharacterized protein n=1 Tax=Chrysophaeum taylorii TaxID=2483200 RepID=A0AAD7UK05_9STRA|nr:hypothetical protein CTAYLR_008133 [Chrysophaeum taylorii]